MNIASNVVMTHCINHIFLMLLWKNHSTELGCSSCHEKYTTPNKSMSKFKDEFYSIYNILKLPKHWVGVIGITSVRYVMYLYLCHRTWHCICMYARVCFKFAIG